MLNNDYYLLYICTNPLKKGTCLSAVVMPPRQDGVPSLRRAFHNAWLTFQTQPADNKKNPAGSALARGQVIATLGAAYLGNIPVKKQTGTEVVAAAVDALRRRGARDAVTVQIGTEGVRMTDTLTEEPVEKIVLGDIAFAAPYKDAVHPFIFALIAKDASLGMTACHVLELDQASHKDMEIALKQTFLLLSEERKLGQDPFKPVGGRTPAPEDLFKRQIHRRHLTAIKPIGAGQVRIFKPPDRRRDL